MYFAGDGAKRDEDGYFWLLGRVDDVMNVSGHRLSTTEIESALVSHPAVAEAAVVGGPDPVTGEAINAFVILRARQRADARARRGAARSTSPPRSARSPSPSTLMFTPDLPKTRSGKIMRRLLRDIAQGTRPRRHHDARRRRRRRDHPRELRHGRGLTACRSTSCKPKEGRRRQPRRAVRLPCRSAVGRAVRRPDRGVADRRRDADRGPASDALNKREAIDDLGRPMGADRRLRSRCRRRRGSRASTRTTSSSSSRARRPCRR